jgi:hypothetical protein
MDLSRVSGAGMPDVLEQLKKLGLNQVTASMAIPYMWFTPATSDPYSPVVILIVRGAQNGLRRLGIQTRGDGFIDRATSNAFTRIAGAHWKGKAWVQVYSDIIDTIEGRAPLAPKGNSMTYSTGLGNHDYHGMGHNYHGRYGSLGATFEPGEGTSFVNRNGICVPLKGPADDITINLRAHKELQRQVNRNMSKLGGKLIAEDGDIGPLTVSAVHTVFAAKGRSISGGCSHIATMIGGLTNDLRGYADSLGAKDKPLGVPSGGPSRVVDPVTGQDQHVSATGPMGETSMWIGVALVVAALVAWKKGKPKKKRKKPRRRRRLPKSRTTVTRYR